MFMTFQEVFLCIVSVGELIRSRRVVAVPCSSTGGDVLSLEDGVPGGKESPGVGPVVCIGSKTCCYQGDDLYVVYFDGKQMFRSFWM